MPNNRQRARNRGRSFESRVARFWGTRRTPLSGICSGHTHADTLHKDLFIECKIDKRYGTLWSWWDYAKAHCSPWRGVLMVIDKAREEEPYFVVGSNDWQWVREYRMEEVIGTMDPDGANWRVREGTSVGSLLYNVRRRAAEEKKIPMLAIGYPNRRGFLITVHGLEWDLAREYQGGLK